MTQHAALRPIERRILRLTEEGVDDIEIAWRFRRSPRFVRQVVALAGMPRDGAPAGNSVQDGLRPIERAVLFWRKQGLDHEQMAPRFRRGAPFLRQVEAMANYKMARQA